jgi:hypothetical protein
VISQFLSAQYLAMFDTTRSAPPPPSEEMTKVILISSLSLDYKPPSDYRVRGEPDYHAGMELISSHRMRE